jgi:hypothetical protein
MDAACLRIIDLLKQSEDYNRLGLHGDSINWLDRLKEMNYDKVFSSEAEYKAWVKAAEHVDVFNNPILHRALAEELSARGLKKPAQIELAVRRFAELDQKTQAEVVDGLMDRFAQMETPEGIQKFEQIQKIAKQQGVTPDQYLDLKKFWENTEKEGHEGFRRALMMTLFNSPKGMAAKTAQNKGWIAAFRDYFKKSKPLLALRPREVSPEAFMSGRNSPFDSEALQAHLNKLSPSGREYFLRRYSSKFTPSQLEAALKLEGLPADIQKELSGLRQKYLASSEHWVKLDAVREELSNARKALESATKAEKKAAKVQEGMEEADHRSVISALRRLEGVDAPKKVEIIEELFEQNASSMSSKQFTEVALTLLSLWENPKFMEDASYRAQTLRGAFSWEAPTILGPDLLRISTGLKLTVEAFREKNATHKREVVEAMIEFADDKTSLTADEAHRFKEDLYDFADSIGDKGTKQETLQLISTAQLSKKKSKKSTSAPVDIAAVSARIIELENQIPALETAAKNAEAKLISELNPGVTEGVQEVLPPMPESSGSEGREPSRNIERVRD